MYLQITIDTYFINISTVHLVSTTFPHGSNTHLAVQTFKTRLHSGVGSVNANPISSSPISSSAIKSFRFG